MSPVIYREKKNKYYFFSREESRIHIHVSSPNGEAKFWLEPIVALASSSNFTSKELNSIQKVVEKNCEKFKSEWKKFFKKL